MQPSEIISFVRKQTGATSDQVSDDQMYVYFNIVYKKIREKIANLDANYGLTTLKTDLLNGVNEYKLKSVDGYTKNFGQYKIDMITVDYYGNGNRPFFLKYSDRNQMNKSPEYYEDYYFLGNEDNCFFTLKNDSFFIFPKPQRNVPNGITVYGTKRPYDISCGMNESDILLEPEYHDLIGKGMFEYVYQERQLLDRKSFAKQEFIADLQDMLVNIKKRVVRPLIGGTTYDNFEGFVGKNYYIKNI